MTKTFKCKVCKGSGEVPNPDFEQCANLNDEIPKGKCQGCVYYSDCSKGEFVFCDNCSGNGSLTIDLSKWTPITASS